MVPQFFNIYWLLNGEAGVAEGLDMECIQLQSTHILTLGGEITGIIDSDKDK